jgi:hypothetical protein
MQPTQMGTEVTTSMSTVLAASLAMKPAAASLSGVKSFVESWKQQMHSAEIQTSEPGAVDPVAASRSDAAKTASGEGLGPIQDDTAELDKPDQAGGLNSLDGATSPTRLPTTLSTAVNTAEARAVGLKWPGPVVVGTKGKSAPDSSLALKPQSNVSGAGDQCGDGAAGLTQAASVVNTSQIMPVKKDTIAGDEAQIMLVPATTGQRTMSATAQAGLAQRIPGSESEKVKVAATAGAAEMITTPSAMKDNAVTINDSSAPVLNAADLIRHVGAGAAPVTLDGRHEGFIEQIGTVVPFATSGHAARADATTTTISAAVGAPQILAAGPAKLDVGVFDGTHGWLRIRAEIGTGGVVNASLTASVGSHASLRAALPEMSRYLDAEAVSVGKLAVHRATGSSGAVLAGNDSGNRQSAGHSRGQRHAPGQSNSVQPQHTAKVPILPTTGTTARLTTDASAWAMSSRLGLDVAHTRNGYGLGSAAGGSWLNVSA